MGDDEPLEIIDDGLDAISGLPGPGQKEEEYRKGMTDMRNAAKPLLDCLDAHKARIRELRARLDQLAGKYLGYLLLLGTPPEEALRKSTWQCSADLR